MAVRLPSALYSDGPIIDEGFISRDNLPIEFV